MDSSTSAAPRPARASGVQEEPEKNWSTQGVVTVLFTDAEGSTALQAARGDADARAVLAACDQLSRRQVAAHAGRIIKSTGDGLMVGFVSPRQAVACALAINTAIAEHSRRNPHLAVRLRIGLHTGEVLEEAGDLHGAAVSAAARICAKAQGGEVLVSDVVRQLCGTVPGAAFWDYGRLILRGFPEQWHLFRVMPSVEVHSAAGAVTTFIGREPIRSELRALLERAATGHGTLVMIGGAPGVGKTRLAQEVGREAQQRGMGVYTGYCYETGGNLSYMPWVEMLEGAARRLAPDVLLELLGEHAPALAQIAPELRRMAPNIPPPVELPGEQQRRYLFNAVRTWLSRVAQARPRLLIFEDLHWADESTLLLIEHLVEWIASTPILVVGTYRDTPMDRSESLAATLARLVQRRHQVSLTSLASHTQAEVEEMLRVLSGDPPPPEVTAAIYAESDGNAFFVEEVFRHFAESGRLLDEHGRFRTDVQIGELEVPANVRLVISRRLERLAEPTRRMLAVAAIMGRNFSFDILEHVLEMDGADLLDALEAAERAQIIVEQPRGFEAHYRFAHELFRQTLLTQLSTPRRQRYHLRIADALERAYADALEIHAADIARHLVRAGSAAKPARTAHYLTLAGDRRHAAAAYEEALRDYEQALALLPAGGDRTRADLLVKIGLTLRCLRRWEDAAAKWDEALTLLERSGETETMGALCWELSKQLTWGFKFAEMAEVARRGLAVLGDRASPEQARLLAMTGLALGLSGDSARADAHLAAAKRFAEPTGDTLLLSDIGMAETVLHYFFMRLPETVEAGRRTTDKLRQAVNPWNLAEVLGWLDVGLAFQGRFAESAALHRELEPLAEKLGNWGAASVAQRTTFAVAAARDGDLAGLERLTGSLMAVTVDTGNRGWVALSSTMQGIVEFWRGKWPEARAHMESGARLAMPFWFGPQHGLLLVLRAFCGERDEVYAQLDQLESALPRPGRANLLGAWNLAILAAEAVGFLGGAERAAALYPLVVEALATGALMRQPDGRLLQTAAGMVAAAAGLDEAAEGHFELALRQAEELPHVLERPHARHFYARFLIDRDASGDCERAASLLEEAVAGYKAIGMPRHETLASHLLAGVRQAGERTLPRLTMLSRKAC